MIDSLSEQDSINQVDIPIWKHITVLKAEYYQIKTNYLQTSRRVDRADAVVDQCLILTDIQINGNDQYEIRSCRI